MTDLTVLHGTVTDLTVLQVHEIWGNDVEIEIEEDQTGDDHHTAVDLNSITDVSDRDLEQLVSMLQPPSATPRAQVAVEAPLCLSAICRSSRDSSFRCVRLVILHRLPAKEKE